MPHLAMRCPVLHPPESTGSNNGAHILGLSAGRSHLFQPPRADQMSDSVVRVSTRRHICTFMNKLANTSKIICQMNCTIMGDKEHCTHQIHSMGSSVMCHVAHVACKQRGGAQWQALRQLHSSTHLALRLLCKGLPLIANSNSFFAGGSWLASSDSALQTSSRPSDASSGPRLDSIALRGVRIVPAPGGRCCGW